MALPLTLRTVSLFRRTARYVLVIFSFFAFRNVRCAISMLSAFGVIHACFMNDKFACMLQPHAEKIKVQTLERQEPATDVIMRHELESGSVSALDHTYDFERT